MYLKKLFTCIAAAAVLSLPTSCNEEEDPIVEKDPVLKVSPEVVEVPVEGGEFTVNYSIENPVEGGALEASCPEGWITSFNYETQGKISFQVESSKVTEVRSAIVEVTYTNLKKSAQFTVKQAAYKAPDPFKVELKNTTNVAGFVSVTPYDKEMRYLVRRKGADKMQQFENDEALFQSDIVSLQKEADNAEMSISELLKECTFVGDQTEIELSVLKPGDDFVCYVYGIDIDSAERLTDIIKLEFSTVPVETQDVEFYLNAEVYIAKAQITFDTENYDGYYYCSIYELKDEENLENRLMNLLTDEWMSNYAFFYGLNWAPEQMMEDSAFKGEVQEVLDLEAETSYVLAAVALNSDGLICSAKPAYYIFKTDKPKESNNTFDIEISSIGSTKAFLKITPSNEDPYAAGILPYDYISELETEEEIIDFLINQFMPNTFHGTFAEEVRPLDPETEYYVFAFGYEAYTATTPLTFKTFTTEAKSDEVSEVKGYLDYGDYADSKAVGAIDELYAEIAEPGYALIPFTTRSEPEGLKVYWNVFREEDLQDPSITEEMLVEALTLGGFNYSFDIFQLPYGISLVGAAVAEDAKGNPGKVFIGEPLVLTLEGVIPADEFVEKYPFPTEQANVPYRVASPKEFQLSPLMSELYSVKHTSK